jgi:hypothetical protein
MTTADKYRQYAHECIHWAKEAETDDQRQSFLNMARDWTLAALRITMTPRQYKQLSAATLPEQ